MIKKIFITTILFLYMSILMGNNPFTVSGIVTDNLGEPLIGAHVVLKGAKTGTVTNVDGVYTIQANEGDVLSFSYVGFDKKEVKVTGKELNVSLELDDNLLDDVVIVGYGQQKKGSVTGSVSQVNANEIIRAPVGPISNMIAGRLPGLVSKQTSGMPGGDGSSMTIRGASSFYSENNKPVMIVDGVRRDFDQLNADEIESITILKDASAAAVYGLQAAAGVILVTTKKGKEGKPKINFNSSYSLSENTMFPKFLNGPEYAYWYNKARMLNGKEALFSNSDIRKMIEGDPEGKWGNTNWVDEVFKSGHTYNNSISIDGGTKDLSYFFSGGHHKQDGNVKNINFERFNFRTNIDANIAKHLQVSVGLGGRKEKREAPTYSTGKNEFNNVFQQAMRTHPYLPKTYDGLPTGTKVNGPMVSAISALDDSGFRNNESEYFESNIKLKLDMPWITKGLSASFMGSYDHRTQYNKALQTPYKISQGIVNQEGIRYQTVESSIGVNAKLAENFSRKSLLTIQPSINYNRSFGKHSVSALFLYEQFRELSNYMSISTQGLEFTSLPELDFAQELTTGAGAFRGYSDERPRSGYVGRLNYAFDQKYLLELSGRYDASYKFSSDSRWALFPAASIGWRISEEGFFKQALPFVGNLKLRGSIGKLGNDGAVSPYGFLNTLTQLGTAASVVIGEKEQFAYQTSKIANAALTWENVMVYNFGFEADLWNGLLGIEFDVYYKVTKDILEKQGADYPPSFGGYYPEFINTGVADNRGFELSLRHNNHISDFNYGANFNISLYDNKYIDVKESANIQDHLKRNGRRLGQKHGLVALGLFQTDEEARNWPSLFGDQRAGDIKYLDVNGDGQLTYNDDRMWIADSNVPRLNSSLYLHADYKGFDFSIMFQGAALAEYALSGSYPDIGYDNTEFTSAFFQLGNSPKYLVENSWTPDNRDAKYPRLSDIKVQNNKWASTLWIVDGSYLRIKTVQLGYTLPKKIVNRIGANNLRFFVSGGNLFTWTEFKYMDPEAPDVSNGFYPQQRTYAFGLNLTF